MEISKENITSAYQTADENGKRMLTALFGEEAVKEVVKLPVTERIKTFEDACKELDENNELVSQYRVCCLACDAIPNSSELMAYLKLRIICAALNEGWEPKFTEDEKRWYPWFFLYTQEEINTKTNDWKKQRQLIETGGYATDYCGFAYAYSDFVPSNTSTGIGSRLCFKSEELATYCGRKFINIWADYQLIRK